jgi:hypothetical protein
MTLPFLFVSDLEATVHVETNRESSTGGRQGGMFISRALLPSKYYGYSGET